MDEERLFRELGGIQKVLEKLCDNDRKQEEKLENLEAKIDTKFQHLPCHVQAEKCAKEMKNKVNWNVFTWIIGFIVAVIMGSYAYTHESNQEHRALIEKKHPITSEPVTIPKYVPPDSLEE